MLALVGANTPVQYNGPEFEIKPQPLTTFSGIFLISEDNFEMRGDFPFSGLICGLTIIFSELFSQDVTVQRE